VLADNPNTDVETSERQDKRPNQTRNIQNCGEEIAVHKKGQGSLSPCPLRSLDVFADKLGTNSPTEQAERNSRHADSDGRRSRDNSCRVSNRAICERPSPNPQQ